jgi:hypothetical protein
VQDHRDVVEIVIREVSSRVAGWGVRGLVAAKKSTLNIAFDTERGKERAPVTLVLGGVLNPVRSGVLNAGMQPGGSVACLKTIL